MQIPLISNPNTLVRVSIIVLAVLFAPVSAQEAPTSPPAGQQGTQSQYWVSSTGKVHNPSCRYYGKSNKGRYTDSPKGTNCKICGGTRNHN